MERLAWLSNTHGQVATRPPTAFAKNANRALPWSRTSTGLTGHGDSYPLAKQRNPIPINRGDCDQKNAKYYARGLDQSTSRRPGKTQSMEPPRSRLRQALRVL